MLLRLFLTFFKINILSVSGPASIGLTEELVVPAFITKEQFIEAVAIASGIPGSDAIQMALQIGFTAKGLLGAVVSILGALLPSITLAGFVLVGINLIPQDVLKRFFEGVTPALVVLLIINAVKMFPTWNWFTGIIAIIAMGLIMIKVPVVVVLLTCGAFGIYVGMK